MAVSQVARTAGAASISCHRCPSGFIAGTGSHTSGGGLPVTIQAFAANTPESPIGGLLMRHHGETYLKAQSAARGGG